MTGQVPTREHCGERSAVGCVVMGGKGWEVWGLGGGRGIVGGIWGVGEGLLKLKGGWGKGERGSEGGEGNLGEVLGCGK